MSFKIQLCAALVAIFGTSAALASDVLPSASDTFTKWGTVEGWTVYVNDNRGTCLVERIDENKNVVQMGLTADSEFGYLGVFTQSDIDFKDDQVFMLLDDRPYVGDATAAPKNLAQGYKGGYVLANNPNFVEDVMKRYTMVVMPEHQNSFEVSLDGTFKAIEAARECNAEQTS